VNVKYWDFRLAVFSSRRCSRRQGAGATGGLAFVEIARAVVDDGHTAVRGLDTINRGWSGALMMGVHASFKAGILKLGQVTNRFLATPGA